MNENLDALVYEFFRTFARFEYALKASGFHRAKRNNAEADWMGFADSPPVREVLDDPVDAGLKEATDHILNNPPNKQVIENGAVTWSDNPPDATSQSGRVIAYVCRVRNNLFHGGKKIDHFHGRKKFDHERKRTERLLKHSLTILRGCLDASGDVAGAYQDGEQQP